MVPRRSTSFASLSRSLARAASWRRRSSSSVSGVRRKMSRSHPKPAMRAAYARTAWPGTRSR